MAEYRGVFAAPVDFGEEPASPTESIMETIKGILGLGHAAPKTRKANLRQQRKTHRQELDQSHQIRSRRKPLSDVVIRVFCRTKNWLRGYTISRLWPPATALSDRNQPEEGYLIQSGPDGRSG